MKAKHEFSGAALPWIALGLLLAIFFVRMAGRKKAEEKKEDYGAEGMSVGMMLGMLIGLVIGLAKEKEDE